MKTTASVYSYNKNECVRVSVCGVCVNYEITRTDDDEVKREQKKKQCK